MEPARPDAYEPHQARLLDMAEDGIVGTDGAHVLTAAIERPRTARQLERARDVERRRIARALHDEALQDLRYALERA